MPEGWGFIKRLGMRGNNQSPEGSVLDKVGDFELSDDDEHGLRVSPTPLLRKALSWDSSFGSFGAIRRLGRSNTLPARSSVMFDADAFTPPVEEGQKLGTRPSPVKLPVFPRQNGRNLVETHVAPARSSLTFLQRVAKLGDVHAAIEQEVRARQMETARSPADASTAADMAHNPNARRAHLSTADITKNFKANGADLTAAQIALAYIDVSYSHIQANEINSPGHDAKSDTGKQTAPNVEAKKLQGSRGSYDDRSHSGGHDR